MKFLSIIFLFSQFASAFPEMVRHGYSRCITCHVNSNGGGVLTRYGRVLSETLLSAESRENEGNFLYGLLNPPEPLLVGGHFRALQMFRETSRLEEARFIPMQTELEGAANYSHFQVEATLGLQRPSKGSALQSRRHTGTYKVNQSLRFVVGKDVIPFGINISDHTAYIKHGLGIGRGTESYQLQTSWNHDAWEFLASLNFSGNIGAIFRAIASIGSHSLLGLSYFYQNDPTRAAHLLGPFVVVGVTPSLYVLSELDFEIDKKVKVVNYFKLGYELFLGFHVFAFEESIQQSDFTQIAYGGGLQVFPRPHLEFLCQTKMEHLKTSLSKTFWLLLHIYL